MILFDSSMALNRCLFANLDDVAADPQYITHLMLTQIIMYMNRFGASKENPFVIAVDSQNTWRKVFFCENRHKVVGLENEEYKGQRKKSADIDWTAIYKCYDAMLEVLEKTTDLFVMKVDSCEADDVIAVLTKEFKEQQPIWIISSDKDFLQLQEKNKVSIYDQHKAAFKPDVDTKLYTLIHTMIGDKSDNIKAIRPRLGEKTALKILKDLPDLLKTDPNINAAFKFNQVLIDFNYIPEDIQTRIRESYKEQKFSYHAMNLLSGFMSLGIRQHIEDINDFKLPDTKPDTMLTKNVNGVKLMEDTESTNLEDFFS